MPDVLDKIDSPRAVPPSALLGAKITALRRKHVGVAVFTGIATAVVVAIELLALAMFLDWWLDLPWGVRLALLAAQFAVFAYILLRMIVAPVLRQPDEDDLALMVEKARPEFHSRLIAAIQLARPGAVPSGASASLAEAMIEQTEAIADPIPFTKIVATDKLKRIGALAIIVPVIAVVGLTSGRDVCLDLLKRALLSNVPVPRKTRVLVIDGDKIIGLGDSVRIEAFVQGIVPNSGKLKVEYRNRRAQEYSLEQDRDNRARFGRTIENVQDTFHYTVYLNDGVSSTHEVKAIPRPTVATIECEQEYPGYTRLKPVRRSLGDLSLLAGSQLKLKVTATKPLKTAALKLSGMDGEVPMTLNAQNVKEATGEFTIPGKGMNGFSVLMLDTEDMESRDSAVHRVEIIPDKIPVVRITYPDRKEELITRQATMIVAFEATDDFAIAHIRLKYKIDTLDSGAEKVVELDLGGEQPQRLRRRHEWKIGEFSPLLAEGSTIEYWIEAEDNNNATGPGIGATDHQLAKVVSENEKRADLLNRAGDYLGSISDVATDQEKLNKNLGTIILEKTGPRP
jgi:hypothetical protein